MWEKQEKHGKHNFRGILNTEISANVQTDIQISEQ